MFAIVLLMIGCTNAQVENQQDNILVKQDEDTSNRLILFQLYGERVPDNYVDEGDTITERYGFKVVRVAGCEVNEDLLDEAHKLNNASMNQMNKKFGIDWREKFERDTGMKLVIPLR